MLIRSFQPGDEVAVIALWQACGLTRPWNNPALDIQRKLLVQPELFLIGELDGQIVASAMAGFDGHRGWINYLGVAPEHRRKGLARALVERVEVLLRERGCPKLNLQVRNDNAEALGFYSALGYGQDAAISLGKRLIVDG